MANYVNSVHSVNIASVKSQPILTVFIFKKKVQLAILNSLLFLSFNLSCLFAFFFDTFFSFFSYQPLSLLSNTLAPAYFSFIFLIISLTKRTS